MRVSITLSVQGRDYLAALTPDPLLQPGAQNVIRNCLNVSSGEAVLFLVETGYEDLAAALLHEAEAASARTFAIIMGDYHTLNERFIHRIEEKLAESDASILVASASGLPVAFRKRVIAAGSQRRHAHMAGITIPMMLQGMRADYNEVHAFGERLREHFRPETGIQVSTVIGTQVAVRCEPAFAWHNRSGILREPGWTELPGGEVYTVPGTIDGVVVPEGGVWLDDLSELPRGNLLQLHFEGGVLKRIEGRDDAVVTALTRVVDQHPNGRRVGRVAFGTNTTLVTPIGGLPQDLKMPGFYFVLGDTYPAVTGASWSSSGEVRLLLRRPDVLVDGMPMMVRGRYVGRFHKDSQRP